MAGLNFLWNKESAGWYQWILWVDERQFLNQLIEYVDLIADSSTQGLAMIDVILANIRDGDIDKSNFVELSITNTVKKAIKQYAYKNEEEKNLLNLNLEDDFIVGGDEKYDDFCYF